jgi:hypothetical protein
MQQPKQILLTQKRIPVFDIVMISLTYVSRMIEEAFFSESVFLGAGVVFFAFIPFLIHTYLRNQGSILVAFTNPVVIIIGLFTLYAFTNEYLHPTPSYRDVSRTFFMALSIPLFAVWVYRDIRYLYYMTVIFIAYSLVHSLNIALTVSLPEMLSQGNSNTARDLLLEKSFFFSNSNGISFLAGTSFVLCYIIVSFADLSRASKFTYKVLMVIFFYTIVLCLSRSGTLNFVFLLLMLFLRSRIKPGMATIAAMTFGVIIFIASSNDTITDFLFSRFESVTLNEEEATDSRAILYIKVLKHLDEVFWWGVGEGNYYGKWGMNSEFGKTIYDIEDGSIYEKVPPTHNSFAQIIYYWGIIALAFYMLFQFRIFRYLQSDRDNMYVQITNILFFSTFSLIIFSNNFNAKDFSFIYGSIIGLYLNNRYRFTD